MDISAPAMAFQHISNALLADQNGDTQTAYVAYLFGINRLSERLIEDTESSPGSQSGSGLLTPAEREKHIVFILKCAERLNEIHGAISQADEPRKAMVSSAISSSKASPVQQKSQRVVPQNQAHKPAVPVSGAKPATVIRSEKGSVASSTESQAKKSWRGTSHSQSPMEKVKEENRRQMATYFKRIAKAKDQKEENRRQMATYFKRIAKVKDVRLKGEDQGGSNRRQMATYFKRIAKAKDQKIRSQLYLELQRRIQENLLVARKRQVLWEANQREVDEKANAEADSRFPEEPGRTLYVETKKYVEGEGGGAKQAPPPLSPDQPITNAAMTASIRKVLRDPNHPLTLFLQVSCDKVREKVAVVVERSTVSSETVEDMVALDDIGDEGGVQRLVDSLDAEDEDVRDDKEAEDEVQRLIRQAAQEMGEESDAPQPPEESQDDRLERLRRELGVARAGGPTNQKDEEAEDSLKKLRQKLEELRPWSDQKLREDLKAEKILSGVLSNEGGGGGLSSSSGRVGAQLADEIARQAKDIFPAAPQKKGKQKKSEDSWLSSEAKSLEEVAMLEKKMAEEKMAALQDDAMRRHLRDAVQDIRTDLGCLTGVFLTVIMNLDRSADRQNWENCYRFVMEELAELYFRPLSKNLLDLYSLVHWQDLMSLENGIRVEESEEPQEQQAGRPAFADSDVSRVKADFQKMIRDKGSPFAKIRVLTETLQFLSSQESMGSTVGADDLVPLLSTALVSTGLSEMAVHALFIEDFVSDTTGEVGYCLATLITVVEWLKEQGRAGNTDDLQTFSEVLEALRSGNELNLIFNMEGDRRVKVIPADFWIYEKFSDFLDPVIRFRSVGEIWVEDDSSTPTIVHDSVALYPTGDIILTSESVHAGDWANGSVRVFYSQLNSNGTRILKTFGGELQELGEPSDISISLGQHLVSVFEMTECSGFEELPEGFEFRYGHWIPLISEDVQDLLLNFIDRVIISPAEAVNTYSFSEDWTEIRLSDGYANVTDYRFSLPDEEIINLRSFNCSLGQSVRLFTRHQGLPTVVHNSSVDMFQALQQGAELVAHVDSSRCEVLQDDLEIHDFIMAHRIQEFRMASIQTIEFSSWDQKVFVNVRVPLDEEIALIRLSEYGQLIKAASDVRAGETILSCPFGTAFWTTSYDPSKTQVKSVEELYGLILEGQQFSLISDFSACEGSESIPASYNGWAGSKVYNPSMDAGQVLGTLEIRSPEDGRQIQHVVNWVLEGSGRIVYHFSTVDTTENQYQILEKAVVTCQVELELVAGDAKIFRS
ncbi:unnamed protein product [Cyprideis torosa]|uniref:Uncharacterized protein n=1 Tax=Cyprideis torosa TaxID=163714 RepID=A0A7R8W9M0_9CRUS|nr:unnamed protein product [Cyprideis torosa]CAG0888680.1 unnamed protein product [Cyprideis torosa]